MIAKTVAVIALAASAQAFAPTVVGRTSVSLNLVDGAYDGKLFDNEAKKAIYAAWDPNSPRDVNNFNPFETKGGNSPDASGRFPGETGYKDPVRGDVSYASMLVEKEELAARAAAPKAGEVPGCPGCV